MTSSANPVIISNLGLIVTTLFTISTLKLLLPVQVPPSTAISPVPPNGIAFTASFKVSNTLISSPIVKTKLGSIIVKVVPGYPYLLVFPISSSFNM